MTLSNEQINKLLDEEKRTSQQTILINGFAWDFLDIFQVLHELLELRQEVERLKSEQSEVAAQAVNSVKDWFVDLSENHNSTTISEMCEWSAKQIAVYQVRGQGHE